MMAVEGKVNEGFGKTVTEWNPHSSANKITRLTGLSDKLGLATGQLMNVKYQLVHRTASALVEAKSFGASCAVMLVHSFSQTDEHLEDFVAFADLFGVSDATDTVSYAGNKNGIDLYLAWVRGEKRFLEV